MVFETGSAAAEHFGGAGRMKKYGLDAKGWTESGDSGEALFL